MYVPLSRTFSIGSSPDLKRTWRRRYVAGQRLKRRFGRFLTMQTVLAGICSTSRITRACYAPFHERNGAPPAPPRRIKLRVRAPSFVKTEDATCCVAPDPRLPVVFDDSGLRSNLPSLHSSLHWCSVHSCTSSCVRRT